jgi:hypothetical protein
VKWGLPIAAALALSAWVAVSPAKDTYESFDSQEQALDSDAAASRTCRNGPLQRPRPGCAPKPPPSTGNPYEDCVARINQLRRKCQCLPPLARWKGGEACANKHAKHDAKNGIHAGFNSKVCKPHGRAQNECPAWPSAERVVHACLQRMWDEGPGRRFSKHGHYVNMSSLEYESVACGFAKDENGDVWSVQNFR